MSKKISIFDKMDFFTSTEFYCLSLVAAIALVGMLMHQSPPKPAETYIQSLLLAEVGSDDSEMVRLRVMPDGAVLLVRTGLIGGGEFAVNLVAEKREGKVTIVEKCGRMSTAPAVPLRGMAELRFFSRGRCAIRYESEITGSWGTASLWISEGNEAEIELRL